MVQLRAHSFMFSSFMFSSFMFAVLFMLAVTLAGGSNCDMIMTLGYFRGSEFLQRQTETSEISLQKSRFTGQLNLCGPHLTVDSVVSFWSLGDVESFFSIDTWALTPWLRLDHSRVPHWA